MRNQQADKIRTHDDTQGANALAQELPNEAASEAKKWEQCKVFSQEIKPDKKYI